VIRTFPLVLSSRVTVGLIVRRPKSFGGSEEAASDLGRLRVRPGQGNWRGYYDSDWENKEGSKVRKLGGTRKGSVSVRCARLISGVGCARNPFFFT